MEKLCIFATRNNLSHTIHTFSTLNLQIIQVAQTLIFILLIKRICSNKALWPTKYNLSTSFRNVIERGP